MRKVEPPIRRRRLAARIRRQIEAGRDPALGFLHIPKTGGTSIQSWFAALGERGVRLPLFLGHNLDREARLALTPDTRLVFILRDPLDRIVSGFHSRLRCGRPRYDAPWTRREARAFAEFGRPEDLLRALASTDEAERKRAERAFDAIGHLKRGYEWYFGDADEARRDSEAGRFALIGALDDMPGFVARLAALLGASPEEAASIYASEHVAEKPAAARPEDALSPEERERLRGRFAREYAIWSALRAARAGA